jgi:hypothetical protein
MIGCNSREILVKFSWEFQSLTQLQALTFSLIDEIERYKRYGIYTNGQKTCVVCIVAFQVFNERKKQYIQMYLESGREMA